MTETTASQPLSQATVCLNGIDASTREWMASCQPDLQFTDARQAGVVASFYGGDDFEAALARDYDFIRTHNIRTVLCLSDSPPSLVHLIQLHVHHAIFPGMPFGDDAFRLVIAPASRAMLHEEKPFFSARDYDLQTIESFRIQSAADCETAVAATASFFRAHNCDAKKADGASLAVKEALTNSIYHGYRKAASHERKYQPAAFSHLEDGDQVTLTLAASTDCMIVRVIDNAGTLGPLRFANSLDRQMSHRGLMDRRGRGFYLMRQLSDRMVVAFARGNATAIEMYVLRQPNQTEDIRKHFELFEL